MIQLYFFAGIFIGLGIGIALVALWFTLARWHYQREDAEDRDGDL